MSPSRIVHQPQQPSIWELSVGTSRASCMGCLNPMCMKFLPGELRLSDERVNEVPIEIDGVFVNERYRLDAGNTHRQLWLTDVLTVESVLDVALLGRFTLTELQLLYILETKGWISGHQHLKIQKCMKNKFKNS